VLVLHGHSGVGKSELACEVARRLRQHYPGGAFLIDAGPAGAFLEFARIGEAILGQVFPVDMGIPDRCKFVFYSLYNTPTLLIYDNVQSFETVQPWLPMTGMSCHVLITTPCERLSRYLPSLEVPRLSPGEAWHLITEITGGEVAEKYGDRLIELADGLPVQLYPQAWALAAGNQRDHFDPGQLALTQEAKTSFHGVVALLDEKAQLLLHAASFLTGQHIPREELFQQLASAFAWTETDFHHELDACQHLHLLEGKGELRMHQLLAAYLRDLPGDDVRPALTAIRVAQHQRFIGLAHELITVQANATRAARLLVYPLTIEAWKERNETFSIEESETLGNALSEIGRFAEAFPWYQRAVEVREHVDGQKDYARLSCSLHNLGYCLSSQGQFNEARAWFERAVAARQHPDCQGCIDQEGLGRSLHEVGNCLSSLGFFAEAQGWFERAVKARELGDLHGHIDLEGLGRSLYEVGNCLSSRGQFIEAQPWYLRAVEARQQGELHGGVDQESLGWSLHGMAFCLSSQQQFAEAQKWYERAVTAKEQGDIHGRVDHEGLGRSLHEIGYCVSSQGHYVEAQSWYEQAVAARQRGDVYGRVDYEGCGCSLHEVGNCLANQHRYAEAQEWFERAMKIRQQGDLYRRVDQEGRGCSLHSLGYCLSSRKQYAEAQQWFEQAVAAREQGDIYGHVNHDGLGCSLHEMGYCLSCQGRYTEAFTWLARAVEAKRQGDVLGQVNATSLIISLREAARYLRLLARHDEAQKWEEEAEQLLGN